jgi:hypothetical protein
MTQITVIRKITKYEEFVFDTEEQFNEWKKLGDFDSEDWDDNVTHLKEFNAKNFEDIWYETEELSPTEYVAIEGDETQATDDWIFTGIFKNACDLYDLKDMKVLRSSLTSTLFS